MSVFVYCHEMCGDSRLNSLDEVFTSFCRTQLHTAVISGDIKFVKKILSVRSDLALKVDMQGFTPLHLASAGTSLQMVKLLLKAKPEACMFQDKDGKTPLHLAAMKDRVEIMNLLVKERPNAIHQKNDQNGETILHFCIKSNSSVGTLELLVDKLALSRNSDPDIISIDSKDNDGNTILHLAAEMGKIEIVNYLLHSNKIRIDIDALSNLGLKALNMLSQAERNELEIGFHKSFGNTKMLANETLSEKKNHKEVNTQSPRKRDNAERVNALLVVATLIGQIAFQAALNPPGGVWQDDSKVDFYDDTVKFSYYSYRIFGDYTSSSLVSNSQKNLPYYSNDTKGFIDSLVEQIANDDNTVKGLIWNNYTSAIISNYNNSDYNNSAGGGNFYPHLIRYAGFPIMAYKYPEIYVLYMLVNTIAFSLSLTIVFAVICGFVHDKSVAQNRILVMLLCISIGCISIGYLEVLWSLTPDFYIEGPARVSVSIYFGMLCLCGIVLLVWNVVSRMIKLHKKHLTAFNYLKELFTMDASAVGKVALLIIGLFAYVATSEGKLLPI
ncbi:hypothetical protein C5167_021473 [Papaver somniferum]|uniref:uncharacterized protein LOC113345852 n=1 Tax=Papaver somniferum TaxID=3469 RepID=UPI000E6F63DF|nr:uncharacterized protein LOC113345852 [Papaver somniferum]RZC94224.1 hypothetical protein C5167_021473 [Papaver somniferum]